MDDPPTALFASNDLITLGVIDALGDRLAPPDPAVTPGTPRRDHRTGSLALGR